MLAACAQTKESATQTPQKKEQAETEIKDTVQEAAVSPKQEQPLPTLHEMIGLDRSQITALLGKPHFRRHDKPADLWQYSNKKCALDLFLYRIRDGIIYKVTHADVRILNGAKVTEAACFKRLIKHHINQMKNKTTG